jgi:two-component system NtrC family response regulator
METAPRTLNKLLIVDDDEEIRTQMKWALSQAYEVVLAEDRPSAMAAFRDQRPPVVLLDLGLPPDPSGTQEGFAALSEMLAQDSRAKIIISTGQGEKHNALQAIGAGACDFLAKPVVIEELEVILKRTFYLAQLEREYHELQQRLDTDGFQGMLGTSPAMQAVFGSIRKVASTEAPVLILGESGTGKEMAALAIHRRGARKNGPFAAINCSAIPETLLESELFGHEKGSFTGAHTQRKGRIESADGGTLFLDEIGDLPLPLQIKLLRFLQEKNFERVGGRQPIQVDTRVIAATNADLNKAMLEGRFREDLFYRLAVVVIQLPALRDRENDVCLLATDFLRRFAAESHKEGLAFDPEAARALARYSWPGNVRELENRIKRAVIMAERKRLTIRDLELDGSSGALPKASLKEARESIEREMVQHALRKHRGKITPAAAELKISRPTFYELMEKLGIRRPEHEIKDQ